MDTAKEERFKIHIGLLIDSKEYIINKVIHITSAIARVEEEIEIEFPGSLCCAEYRKNEIVLSGKSWIENVNEFRDIIKEKMSWTLQDGDIFKIGRKTYTAEDLRDLYPEEED